MATAVIREFWTTDGTVSANFSTGTWRGQTFTTTVPYLITKVKLQLFRSTGQSPGEITVSIRATSSSLPTGGDLCSGTIDGDSLVEEPGPGNWYDISFGAGYALSGSTQYAIVIRAASALNWAKWTLDQGVTPPVYDGGTYVSSSDSGATWAASAGWNFMFETWGVGVECVTDPGTVTGPTSVILNAHATGVSAGEYIIERGFDYGTETGVYPSSVHEHGTWAQDEAWSLEATGLTAGITHFFRAYIKTEVP